MSETDRQTDNNSISILHFALCHTVNNDAAWVGKWGHETLQVDLTKVSAMPHNSIPVNEHCTTLHQNISADHNLNTKCP